MINEQPLWAFKPHDRYRCKALGRTQSSITPPKLPYGRGYTYAGDKWQVYFTAEPIHPLPYIPNNPQFEKLGNQLCDFYCQD